VAEWFWILLPLNIWLREPTCHTGTVTEGTTDDEIMKTLHLLEEEVIMVANGNATTRKNVLKGEGAVPQVLEDETTAIDVMVSCINLMETTLL
jgi:hypothetical protein